jgi:3-oxoacid CoA-transferase subunit B
MPKGLTAEQMAKRATQEMRDGSHVDLGAGIARLVGSFIPPGVGVVLQSETGLLGIGPQPLEATVHGEVIEAGKVDVAIVGALQVSETGDISGGTVPGEVAERMGGAIELVASAKRVVVVMEHAAKDGSPRILNECSLPLTGRRVAHRIITDLAVIDVTAEGLVLKEVAPGVSAREVQDHTQPTLKVGPDLSTVELGVGAPAPAR